MREDGRDAQKANTLAHKDEFHELESWRAQDDDSVESL